MCGVCIVSVFDHRISLCDIQKTKKISGLGGHIGGICMLHSYVNIRCVFVLC